MVFGQRASEAQLAHIVVGDVVADHVGVGLHRLAQDPRRSRVQRVGPRRAEGLARGSLDPLDADGGVRAADRLGFLHAHTEPTLGVAVVAAARGPHAPGSLAAEQHLDHDLIVVQVSDLGVDRAGLGVGCKRFV